MLLDQDPNINLNLQSFRACSGATTQTMVSGQGNNGNQLSSLSEDTDVVTITIGGNDVEFSNVGYACNFDSGTNACMNQLDESRQITASQQFADDVQGVLDSIGVAAPNASVIVLGYPYILSTPGASTYCGWAVQAASQQERDAVEELVDSLDSVLQDAATGSGALFIDPRSSFDGHYPCYPDPFLNEADPVNPVYSYHPNGNGHEQYASLIGEWLD